MKLLVSFILVLLTINLTAKDGVDRLIFEGGEGLGKGKHIVLISGDEEYRSEESYPMLAQILSKHHGFKTTVLFAIDPKNRTVNPYVNNNVPGLETLTTADLIIVGLRWRQLPDHQMKYFDKYLKSGKPILLTRTGNHAFRFKEGNYQHYSSDYKEKKDRDENHPWFRGFGGLLTGDHYHKHHGRHKHESTRGIFAPEAKGNPILNGIKDGEIWGATDVYRVRVSHLDIRPIVLGQVITRAGKFDPRDKNYGNRETDTKPVEGKNDPMIPVAWYKNYKHPESSKTGICFSTTMGSSTDFENAGLRRLAVNAIYQLLNLEIPASGTKVDYANNYRTTAYGFWGKEYWEKVKLKVNDFRD